MGNTKWNDDDLVFSTLFKSYRDDRRTIMKGSGQ